MIAKAKRVAKDSTNYEISEIHATIVPNHFLRMSPKFGGLAPP